MTQRSSIQVFSSPLKQAQRVTSDMLSDLAASSRRTGSPLAALLDVLTPAARAVGTKSTRTPCCPPELLCPPHCILRITRRAHAGEIVVVPFKIRNPSGKPRSYKLGLRPLEDDRGNAAPTQPTLDRTAIQVEPGEARVVELRLDLTSGYRAGQSFETVVVVREEKYNQNICFALHIEPFTDVPIAEPIPEERLDVHFVSWDKHFYCEPRSARQGLHMRPSESNA